jgi:hypothetical protein
MPSFVSYICPNPPQWTHDGHPILFSKSLSSLFVLNQQPLSPIQQQCTHYNCFYHHITLHISLFRHISSLNNNKCHLIHHTYATIHLNGRTIDILSFSLLCRFLFLHQHSHPLAYDIHQPPFLTPPIIHAYTHCTSSSILSPIIS